MKVTVEKLTGPELMREANEFTTKHTRESLMSLETAYETRHSPMRTQLFVVRMYDIPQECSVHLVRHSCVGQQHYVSSGRPDLGYVDYKKNMSYEEYRALPVDHMMVVNAEHIEEMSWSRLCGKASESTQLLFRDLKKAMYDVDPSLAKRMVSRCVYLGRCQERVPCMGDF